MTTGVSPDLRTRDLRGSGVGRGAAVGSVVRAHPIPVISDLGLTLTQTAEQVGEAFAAVSQRLTEQAEQASDPTISEVLIASAAIAADSELIESVTDRIRAGKRSVEAVDEATHEFVELFSAAGGYLAERATDLRSIRDRVVANLLDLPEPGVPQLSQPSILVAEDLAPADTATLDLDKVLAIVLERGGPTGHTAIIAGQLGIPCVVRVAGANNLVDGDLVAVDAATGRVVVDPDADVRSAVKTRAATLRRLAKNRNAGATSDGHHVDLLANIGTPDDAERLRDVANQGVGLFRTEVLFLDRESAPSETEQIDAYVRVLRSLGSRKTVIRTLDAGADKPLAFVRQGTEENPALGVRGYRLTRTAPEVLATQLSSLVAAGAETGVQPWVMAPMISTAAEAAEFARSARGAGLNRVGVMIEVPAAALRARDILQEVDFVSLGTNDLAQYTMAADRLLGGLADLLTPWQPAVLQLVAEVLTSATQTGKPAGVCGESASDPVMAVVLAGMGATSLSMAPASIPSVRFAISRHTFEQCQRIASAALSKPTAKSARDAAVALMDSEVRDVLDLVRT